VKCIHQVFTTARGTEQTLDVMQCTLTENSSPADSIYSTVTSLSMKLKLPASTQATTVDNVPSVLVSTEVDIYCMLVKFTTYCILLGCGKLRTVAYFQKINWRWNS